MFSIHPSDLRRRQIRCKPIVEEVLKLQKEFVCSCNICKSKQNIIISDKDRYGFPIRSAMCLNCGLVYTVDCLTAKSYSEFYSRGFYRALISRFKGKEWTIKQIQAEQANYIAKLLPVMQGYITFPKGAWLLDVGGSTGLIAHELVKHYGFKATVVDPASKEIDAARKLGLDTVVAKIEDWDTQERFDLILLCATLEHLLDLRGTLVKIHNLLQEGGLFYCGIIDFMETCRCEGSPEAVTKVDHCYWLCQETAIRLFRSLGFEIVFINLIEPLEQIGFLLRKDRPSPLEPVPKEWIEKQLRKLFEIKSDWKLYGETPLNLLDKVRQKAYRLKRRILS